MYHKLGQSKNFDRYYVKKFMATDEKAKMNNKCWCAFLERQVLTKLRTTEDISFVDQLPYYQKMYN